MYLNIYMLMILTNHHHYSKYASKLSIGFILASFSVSNLCTRLCNARVYCLFMSMNLAIIPLAKGETFARTYHT